MSRLVTAPNRAREYETIYIMKPDVDADTADRVGSRLSEVITRESGRLTKVETWGRRRLSYDIRKHRRGVYVYLKYLGTGRVVSEVERNLRLLDGVIKYQTVLVRNDVEVATVEIGAEDVKFDRVELPPLEEERDESRERQLGLIEPERRQERNSEAPLSGDLDDMDAEDLGGDEDEGA
jgi:small subunit ribosomal protein S6